LDILLVVGVKFLVRGDDFFELGMGKAAFHAHHDGFGHLVADDFAHAFLAVAAGGNGRDDHRLCDSFRHTKN